VADDKRFPRQARVELVKLAIEDALTEPEDRRAVADCRFNARVFIRERWGDANAALAEITGKKKAKDGKRPKGGLYCWRCGRRIAEHLTVPFSLRCIRCGAQWNEKTQGMTPSSEAS
jgi:hypothetical protein